MKILKYMKPLSFLPALMLMYCIYSFSAQDSSVSSQVSSSVSYRIVSIFDKMLNLELTNDQITHSINSIHHYVRKTAHFTEYFLLALSLSFPLYVYKLRGIKLIITVILLCVGYASFDEFHQLFVDGRSASAKDVLIDSLGSLTGTLIVQAFGYVLHKKIHRS